MLIEARKLTGPEIRKAKPTDKARKLSDGGGLYLEVMPNGSRYWRMKYRHAGKEKRLAFGVYPEVTLAEARARRDAARAILRDGRDPSAERQAEKQRAVLAAANTFAALAGKWRERRDVSRATAVKDGWLLDFAIKAFGDRPVESITSGDVLALLESLAEREMLETARRLRSKVSAVFVYGGGHNPVTGIARGAIKVPKVKHHAAITNPRRVGELLRAIDAYGGGFITSRALRLAPLVFVRPGELRQAEWSEIDLDAALWRIPAAKMKMGAEHLVPLSSQAVVILREINSLTGRGRFVFPSERGAQRPMSENTLNLALRAMGYDGDTMTSHGFRTIASTLLHELGHSSDVIERQLAHKERNAIKDAYNRAQHLPARRKMMQVWADYLYALREGANVTPIRKVSGASR
ncbi:MAG: integrase arm-type DNA-binding domain-containing protein [Proteobacteria bacterium]|nr:integrase arm-type DNA-binding domain-containing protein [Pseudomonadota bacterium]